jgi:hypothetical protein
MVAMTYPVRSSCAVGWTAVLLTMLLGAGFIRRRAAIGSSATPAAVAGGPRLRREEQASGRFAADARSAGPALRWAAMNYLGAFADGRRLDRRRDLGLPAVVLAVAVAGTFGLQHHHPVAGPDVLDWLLLVAGPVALTVRQFHPVAVLWVTLAATLSPSGSPLANLSLVVAFFAAALSGHRRAGWAAIVAGYAGAVGLEPLIFGRPVGPLTFALLLGAWLLVLVIAA